MVGLGMRHPREMGAQKVEAFLTMLATERRVSASTHIQALNALLFLYREVLAIDLPWPNSGCTPEVFGSRTGGRSAADGSMDTMAFGAWQAAVRLMGE